tara:strand:- start:1569 stop:1751 length:183 start_codon:yes stop_codon:yes gene_type:complete
MFNLMQRYGAREKNTRRNPNNSGQARKRQDSKRAFNAVSTGAPYLKLTSASERASVQANK